MNMFRLIMEMIRTICPIAILIIQIAMLNGFTI